MISPNVCRVFLIITLIVTIVGPARSPVSAEESESPWRPAISGYYKSFFTACDPATYVLPTGEHQDPMTGAVVNRFRLRLFWTVSDAVTFTTAYEVLPTVRDRSDQGFFSFPRPDALTYRVDDLYKTLYPQSGEPEGNFSLGQNLDRLQITIASSWSDLSLGRQPIAFGSARIVNPTDVLAPFTYEELDTEERTGIDAIRLKIPLGDMSELDAGIVIGEEGRRENSAAFVRSKLYYAETDITAILIAFREHLLVGFDCARAIGGAGAWLETAYVYDSILTEDKPDTTKDYLRLSLGLDYTFTGKFYEFVEYHYNGAGFTEPEQYLDAYTYSAYRNAGVYLLGQHYLAPGGTYQLTPLIMLTMTALTNLTDPSTFFSTTLDYSAADEVNVQVGAFIGAGKEAEIDFSQNTSGQPFSIIPNSEFGLYGNTYYTSLRIYF